MKYFHFPGIHVEVLLLSYRLASPTLTKQRSSFPQVKINGASTDMNAVTTSSKRDPCSTFSMVNSLALSFPYELAQRSKTKNLEFLFLSFTYSY